MKLLVYALAWALERAPLARYHSLHALGSDLYYLARYGRGRYDGRWWYGRLGRYVSCPGIGPMAPGGRHEGV
jgi:hypothetical protein